MVRKNKNSKDKPLDLKWPTKPIKALGIYFSYKTEEAANANFVHKLEQLQRQLHWWKARDLSLIGRTLIVKSIGLSKFAFLASVLQIPTEIIVKLNKIIYSFIWKAKCDKVKRDQICKDYSKGGLKVIDFKYVNKAIKVKWVKQYLDPTVQADWKETLNTLSSKEKFNICMLGNYDLQEVNACLPKYYQDTFTFWKEIKCEDCDVKSDLQNQYVWYNKEIKIGNETVFNANLFNIGIWKVSDLYENGKLINFSIWQQRGAKLASYIVWRGILKSIPVRWKEMLKVNEQIRCDCEHALIKCENYTKSLLLISEKELKNAFVALSVNKNDQNTKAFIKYRNNFPMLTVEKWEHSFEYFKSILIENKVWEMQFKLLYNIIGTNKLQHKIGNKHSPNCERCQMYVENVEHLFFYCIVVKNFWYQLINKWNVNHQSEFKIDCFNVLFGIETENDNNVNLNILIMYAKKYIYSCKMEEKEPNYVLFMNYFKRCLKVLCISNCNLTENYLELRSYVD